MRNATSNATNRQEAKVSIVTNGWARETERGRNAGTRLNETPTGPGCGTGHATAHGPRHAAPGPDRTAVPLAPHSGREHARRGNRPAHRGAAPAAGRAVQTPVLPSFARADDM